MRHIRWNWSVKNEQTKQRIVEVRNEKKKKKKKNKIHKEKAYNKANLQLIRLFFFFFSSSMNLSKSTIADTCYSITFGECCDTLALIKSINRISLCLFSLFCQCFRLVIEEMPNCWAYNIYCAMSTFNVNAFFLPPLLLLLLLLVDDAYWCCRRICVTSGTFKPITFLFTFLSTLHTHKLAHTHTNTGNVIVE